MPIEAKLSRTWRNRQLMIAGFLALFALWFLYDGLVGYPRKNLEYGEHQKMKEAGRVDEWPDYSREKGYRLKPPEHSYDDDQIRTQYCLASVAFAGSLVALGILFVSSRRRLRSDDEAVISPSGVRVPFHAIQSVDRKKWDSKGIAVASYDDNGRTGKLVIDDYKYEGAEQILKQVEADLARREGSDGA